MCAKLLKQMNIKTRIGPTMRAIRYGSVDGDRLDCECAFLYLPGLAWTWP